MRSWRLFLLAGLAFQPASGWTETSTGAPVPATRQLSGLHAKEAASLIGKLEDAQRRLRAGESESFELLAGSIASYDMTKVSPRNAFLKVPFEKVWEIKNIRTDAHPGPAYRLAYAPDGLGRLFWEIEVVLGFSGQIERVLMTYKPPAPF